MNAATLSTGLEFSTSLFTRDVLEELSRSMNPARSRSPRRAIARQPLRMTLPASVAFPRRSTEVTTASNLAPAEPDDMELERWDGLA